MGLLEALSLIISIVGALGYFPHGSIGEKEPMLTEALFREVVDRMGRDLREGGSYLDFQPNAGARLALMMRNKELEGEQLDYDSLLDGNPSPSLRDPEYLQRSSLLDGNRNPSLRDQEYLPHSALWGHQNVAGGAGEGEQRLQPSGLIPNRPLVKTDAVLPAYCNPPNPCPVGYTEEQGCITDFENTAAFSRDYQLAQQCMCDGEHMFSCPSDAPDDLMRFSDHHNTMLAKKSTEDENPFLTGERLPIAAKKGFDVSVY